MFHVNYPDPQLSKFPDNLRTEFPCAGTEVVAYEKPQPTAGIHRFAFVVFRQAAPQAIGAPGWRSNFITRDLAECYGLGVPVAAAYFNCQREGSCGGRRYR